MCRKGYYMNLGVATTQRRVCAPVSWPSAPSLHQMRDCVALLARQIGGELPSEPTACLLKGGRECEPAPCFAGLSTRLPVMLHPNPCEGARPRMAQVGVLLPLFLCQVASAGGHDFLDAPCSASAPSHRARCRAKHCRQVMHSQLLLVVGRPGTRVGKRLGCRACAVGPLWRLSLSAQG